MAGGMAGECEQAGGMAGGSVNRLVGWLGSVNRHSRKESIKGASLWPNSSVPVHLPKKGLYITVHSSFVITIKSLKQLICSSTGRGTNCGIFIYLFHGILLSNEKEGTIYISNMVTGTQTLLRERSRNKKIFCMIPFIWSPETDKSSPSDRSQGSGCGS